MIDRSGSTLILSNISKRPTLLISDGCDYRRSGAWYCLFLQPAAFFHGVAKNGASRPVIECKALLTLATSTISHLQK